MQKVRKLLNGILWLGGVVFVVSGFASFVDVQKSLGSLGVIVLTNTEANELAAIYGGLFMVMGALCFFARDRPLDRELTALDRKSTRLNSSHTDISRMPSSA